MMSGKWITRFVPVAGLLLILSGCGFYGQYDDVYLPPFPEEEVEVALSPADYRIYPHDDLEIAVYGHGDLDRKLQVSASGEISFPMVGTLRVAELTAHEAEKKIEERLARYIINPQVTMTVPGIRERIKRGREETETLETEKKTVFVSGQVRRPDVYTLRPGMTVFQAITVAGGLTDIAAPNHTRLVRRRDGEDEVIIVPIGRMMRQGDLSRDVELRPGDVIVVPESFF